MDAAYGENKKYLEPLRSPWQGANGIAWLCVAPFEEVRRERERRERRRRYLLMANLYRTFCILLTTLISLLYPSLLLFILLSFPKVESGAFYLDRVPRVKHVAGPFFSEGTHTKNTPEEVRGRNVLMGKLWSEPYIYAHLRTSFSSSVLFSFFVRYFSTSSWLS